ncbi:MAG: Ppx/GppA family phosphatase [Clostridia bacterium]|nr:Ppx/GppA family phosphatase [Clostridia bacterium]
MKRVAIIDIGTNSIKFFVGEHQEDGTIKTVLDKNDIAQLGEGLRETGLINPEALERNAQSVAAFAKEALENGAEKIVSVGTMALRTAKNSADFVARVKELCGVEVQIIPGEEEARLSYLAVLSGLPLEEGGELVIFDTGGGSTEFIFGQGTTLKNRFSVNLGALIITENFFNDDPVKEGSVDAAIAYIDKEFAAAGVAGKPLQVVGMGGTVTSMGAVKHKMVKYNPDIIQGSTLTREDVQEQVDTYAARTVEQRRELPGLQPKRAGTILAGACILKDILARLDAPQLTISDRGLRHGLAFDLLNK